MEKRDLTQGNILRKMVYISLPIMGTNLMQMMYNLVDMFWLGRLNADAVAAAGTAGMFLWLSMAFQFIGRMGAEIGVSQSMGAGQKAEAQEYAQHGLLLSVSLGIVYSLALIVFRWPLVGFFDIQEAQVAADTRLYLWIVALALPFNFIKSALTGIFNARGY